MSRYGSESEGRKVDDDHRRDMGALMLQNVKAVLEIVRGLVDGAERHGTDPLPDCGSALMDLADMDAALRRLDEHFHGDLDDQIERWLAEPSTRTDLADAVGAAGVGGVVCKISGRPSDLTKTSVDYVVVRINDCSVRLRDQGDRTEKRVRYESWLGRRKQWLVVECASQP